MHKRLSALLLPAALLILTGCAGFTKAPVEPPPAFVVRNVTAPLTTEFTEADVAGLRSGESSAINILGFVSVGDCGIRAAAEDGGLKTVEFADYSDFNVLCVFQKTTVRVYGH